MSKIILDQATAEKLHSLTVAAELYDPAGNVLGRFTPFAFEPVNPALTDDELERRFQATDWYTTAEVLAYLEKL